MLLQMMKERERQRVEEKESEMERESLIYIAAGSEGGTALTTVPLAHCQT